MRAFPTPRHDGAQEEQLQTENLDLLLHVEGDRAERMQDAVGERDEMVSTMPSQRRFGAAKRVPLVAIGR